VQKILWEVRAQILGKGGFLKTVENRCVCEAYYQNIKNELEKKKKNKLSYMQIINLITNLKVKK
jgi:hypothetical protein